MHRPAATTAVTALVLTLAESAHGGSSDPTTVVVEVDNGFHWLDAAVGAASMLALIALAYGALLLRGATTRPSTERSPHA